MLRRKGWEVGKKRVIDSIAWRDCSCGESETPQAHRPAARKTAGTHRTESALGMDFVYDQMLDDRRFRILTVIDQWSRESVCLEVNFQQTCRAVDQALDRSAALRGWPKSITVDITSRALNE
jgi:putative transposase